MGVGNALFYLYVIARAFRPKQSHSSLFLLFFFLDKKETKNQDQAIAPRLSTFYRKSKTRELKLLLRFPGKMLFTPTRHRA
jgi:hypothetical protein